jgi:dTDP-4-amino-4,6-dideoxygalactose transaminase
MDPKSGAIPFCRPTIEQEEIDTVVASLKSGWITSGPKVVEFEKMFRERFKQPHALSVNSATPGGTSSSPRSGSGRGTR